MRTKFSSPYEAGVTSLESAMTSAYKRLIREAIVIADRTLASGDHSYADDAVSVNAHIPNSAVEEDTT